MKYKFIFIWIAAVMLLAEGGYGQESKHISLLAQPGFESMANIEGLPLLHPPGTKKNRIVSYDSSGGNGFGLFLSMFKRYVDDNGEVVFFDAYGPGCLYREQMNIWTDHGIGVKNKNIRIRFYFDDEVTPRVDVPVYEFFNGSCASFTAPFTFRDGEMFGISYYPFCFEKRLRITLADSGLAQMIKNNVETTCNWYQFDYLTYPPGTPIKSWNSETDKFENVVKKQWNHLGEDPKIRINNSCEKKTFSLRPEESVVAFEHTGKASVASIKLKLEPFDAATFCHTYIQISWDDQDVPAVNMPISYFFGAGGMNDGVWSCCLKNLLFGFDASEHSMYCYWPMPFWKNATIKLINKSGKPIHSIVSEIGWTPESELAYPQNESGYFKAKMTEDSSLGGITRKNFSKPYANAFQEEGYGHLVAVNMWSGNFYEDGDEFTYIDGSRTPQIHGDGTEDDFNQGWAGGRHQKALWGALDNGVKGSYRIYLNEPYVFYNSIDMRFEYTNSVYAGESPRKRSGTDNNRIETEFVAWYYHSSSEGRLLLTDSVDVGNKDSERKHSFKVIGEQRMDTLTQGYDSYESNNQYDMLTDDGRSFSKYSEFKVDLDSDNEGVRIRRRINRFENGIQIANVYVDGKKMEAPWHIFTYSDQKNRDGRMFDGWFDSEYEIPAIYTKGKRNIKIKIEHQESSHNMLNSYYYWIYSYCN